MAAALVRFIHHSLTRIHHAIVRCHGPLALSAVLVCCAGCGDVPPPPYALAFTLSGPTPRVLQASQETVVPLSIRNRGQRAWDDSRVHVSYHWLWFIPREIVRRSRTLPYHDGIRTDLAGTVSPGAEVTVEGRLLAPAYPGLYWLQWDLVEEGVTWFAQVSPRQPRLLVVVFPSLAAVFAPLPLLLVLGGLRITRGAGWSRAAGWLVSIAPLTDVLWCAATLWAKSLILIRETLLEPTPVAYCLIVVAAIVPPLVCLVVLPRRARAGVLFACGLFGTLVILGDVVYYRFFGDVLSVSAILGVHQAGRVWGSIRSLLTPSMIWLVVDLPFAAWLTMSFMRTGLSVREHGRLRLVASAALVVAATSGVLATVAVVRTGRLDQMFRDRAVMEQLGPFGYHAYDAWTVARSTAFRPMVTAAEIDMAREWFADRAPVRAGRGPYFGAAAGKNLIVIQVESLQDFVVDRRVAGQDVMPTLRRWTEDGLRFTNVTDETNQGRTSDAEFTALASLLPLDHGAAVFQFPGNHYVGLPRVLTEHGYATLSAVPFESGFWNRRVMHPSYGFTQSLFEPDFELTEQIGWGLSDRGFLQQMAPRLAGLPRPFAAWLITLSLHHPFDDFPDKHKVLKLGALEGTSFGNYLHTMRFFDQAFAEFKAALAQEGLLDESVLVVFGDHDAGFQQDSSLAATIGIGSDGVSSELNDRVPFLVRLPRSATGRTGVVPLAAGQTDFAPTLLALLGIDAARLPYIGRNLLGAPDDSPVLRPYGDWLDGTHLFLDRGASDRNRTCYAWAMARFVNDSACRANNLSARRARDVARLVVRGDLQQQLREALR